MDIKEDARVAYAVHELKWDKQAQRLDSGKFQQVCKEYDVKIPEEVSKEIEKITNLQGLKEFQKKLDDKTESFLSQIAGKISELKTLEKTSGENEDYLTGNMLVNFAETIGITCAIKKLKATQIRKFLDAINKIAVRKEAFELDDVVLLKPKLAYAVARHGEQVEPLMKVFTPCIDKVQSYDDFKRFGKFAEAIVEYHKYYKGQD